VHFRNCVESSRNRKFLKPERLAKLMEVGKLFRTQNCSFSSFMIYYRVVVMGLCCAVQCVCPYSSKRKRPKKPRIGGKLSKKAHKVNYQNKRVTPIATSEMQQQNRSLGNFTYVNSLVLRTCLLHCWTFDKWFNLIALKWIRQHIHTCNFSEG